MVDFKSRGCRTLKKGNTGVCVPGAWYMSVSRFAGAAPLLFCAGVFEIQRKRGLEWSLVCSGRLCTALSATSHSDDATFLCNLGNGSYPCLAES